MWKSLLRVQTGFTILNPEILARSTLGATFALRIPALSLMVQSIILWSLEYFDSCGFTKRVYLLKSSAL